MTVIVQTNLKIYLDKNFFFIQVLFQIRTVEITMISLM